MPTTWTKMTGDWTTVDTVYWNSAHWEKATASCDCTAATTNAANSTASWAHETWSHWVKTQTASITLTSDDIWPEWNVWYVEQAPMRRPTHRREPRVAQPPQTAQAAQEAIARAEKLLAEMLTDAERLEMAEHRYLTVEGGETKRRYRIHTNQGHHGNIDQVDENGRILRSFCVAPGGEMPHADRLIGQKLFIEHAESEFLAKANITERVRAG